MVSDKVKVSGICAALFIFSRFCLPAYADNSQTLVPAGHWIYAAVQDVYLENGQAGFYADAPVSEGELKSYLDAIDYDALSIYGKAQYDRIYAYFYRKNPLTSLSSAVVSGGIRLEVNPELYYKSNPDIPWDMDRYYKHDLLEFPVFLSVADALYIESDFFVGKSYWAVQDPYNWHNLPVVFGGGGQAVNFNDGFEFEWPRRAYLSAGYAFGSGTGINFQIGRNPFSFGSTQTGSIVLSPHFETDGYARLTIFSPNIKYSMSAVQVDVEKYLYTHQLDLRFFKKVKVSVLEGAYINAPFELRFLNPFMIMHSFAFWESDYPSGNRMNNTCAYIAFGVDYTPVKYLRLYALYAQNEIQTPAEGSSGRGSTYPPSLGAQLGAETTVPFHTGAFHAGLEGVYTMPWLYIKHTPNTSLFRDRYDNLSNTSVPINSWIGTPFGPDSAAFSAKLGYEEPGRWSVSLAYLFLAQGENSSADKVFFKDGHKRDPVNNPDDAYYPPTIYDKNPDEAKERGRLITPSGIPQYTNRITLEGEYFFNGRISLAARVAYTAIINTDHVAGRFSQGAELALSCNFKVF